MTRRRTDQKAETASTEPQGKTTKERPAKDDITGRVEQWLRTRSPEAKLTAWLILDLLNGDIGNDELANEILDGFGSDLLDELSRGSFLKRPEDRLALGAWVGLEVARENL